MTAGERAGAPGWLDTAALDALAAAHHARGGQPGLAYGVVAGGRLVHAGGAGECWLGGPSPGEATVFRIASMTKSFTAAAVLALRDDGALALDDPVAAHVPALRGLRLPSADSPPLSLRHLLTMTAGFPTDDPWGDRQQGLPLADFRDLLAGGLSFAWAPGTRFEYSNLGYAILGLVITEVSGRPYPEFVADRLLRPLGMRATGFAAEEFAPGRLAVGHRRGDGGWEKLPFEPYGAFAPMGGIFTCVRDLAPWVGGFAAAFPPGGEVDGGTHPLRRATRREMQAAHVRLPTAAAIRLPGDPAAGPPVGYGFGLFVEEDSASGRVVGHGGGYPGFGSYMRWHLPTGTGVIVLANSTYAAARPLAARLLAAATGQGGAGPAFPVPAAPAVPVLAPAPGGAWPATLAARRSVMALLESWDDAAAGRLFSPNVALDQPLPARRAAIEVLRERLGGLREDASRPAESDTPAHCRWWLRGEHGVAAAQIQLTPEAAPRVMSLVLAVPPAPGSVLAGAVAALLTLLNGAGEWPAALPAAATLDTSLLRRRLAMAGAWAGHCRLGAVRAGNGSTAVTVELDGEHARVIVSVAVDAAGVLQQADVALPA